MLKSKFEDTHNNRAERMPGWKIDGVPVKRQMGMIYWYSWGKHTFDIRVMRRVLGLPKEHTADKWFMAEKPDPCGSFREQMTQLVNALGDRSFSDAMAAHDKAMDEESQAALSKLLQWRPQAAAEPIDAASVSSEEIPF